MPHQGMTIICEKCKNSYCTGCYINCPKCGTRDIADQKTMRFRAKIQKYTKKYLEEKVHNQNQPLPIKKALAELRKQNKETLDSSLSKNYTRKYLQLTNKQLSEIPTSVINGKPRCKRNDVVKYLKKSITKKQTQLF
jgi:hypothetical protein